MTVNQGGHVYDLLGPNQPIEWLREEYGEDPTCIFKGDPDASAIVRVAARPGKVRR